MFYIILLVITIFLSILKKKTEKNTPIDLLILGFMTLIYGIRYSVGTDYIQYQKHYYQSKELDLWFEFLFQKVMELFHFTHAPFWIFMTFIGFIIYLLLYLISKDLNIKYDYLIICFIITGEMFISFNFIRQILAGLIIAYSFKYINSHELIKYVIFNVIAFLIHSSALIFLPLYFIARIQMDRNKWLILFIIGITMYLTNNFNFSLKFLFTSSYSEYFDSVLNSKVPIGLGILLYILVALRISLIHIDRTNKIYPYSSVFLAGYTILLFLYTSRILTRITVYSQLYLIFLIPYIFQYCQSNEFIAAKTIKGPNFINKLIELSNSQKVNKFINILIIVAFFLLFMYKINIIETEDTYNLLYKTVFNTF